MKRPLKERIWFSKPQWYWFGRQTFLPYSWGADEFFWHVWTIGWTLTGQVHIAIRPCPLEKGNAKCREEVEFLAEEGLLPLPGWPVDLYGHNHIECHNPNCYHEEK